MREYNGMYIGKVENNGYPSEGMDTNIYKSDPENRGRIQVRVQGIHTNIDVENIDEGIPIQDLPWAEQAAPFIGGGFGPNNGGMFSIPEIGSFVYLFFLQGDFMKPIYFASVIGNGDYSTTTEPKDRIVLKTAKGSSIVIQDTKDEETILLESSNGSAVEIKTDMITKKPVINIDATTDGKVNITAKELVINGGNFYPLYSNLPGQTYNINGIIFKSASTVKLK